MPQTQYVAHSTRMATSDGMLITPAPYHDCIIGDSMVVYEDDRIVGGIMVLSNIEAMIAISQDYRIVGSHVFCSLPIQNLYLYDGRCRTKCAVAGLVCVVDMTYSCTLDQTK